MYIKQLYTNCLAEAAYYIESNKEVAIVDPLRDTDEYIALAEERGAKIKYIFETHFHADFVSGHLDLAARTGAKIIYGPTAQPSFDAYVAKDDEILPLGDCSIKVLHTPGHTLESSTFLLIDANGKDHSIYTGDTLFIGDVGRPDLAVKTDLTREDLAKHLYNSLRTKLMPLADDIIVYPGHGQGSACGKNMSSETFDTLGNQKKTNYALNPDLTEQAFIQEVTTGLVKPPQYFPKNAVMNKMGYDKLDDVLNKGVNPLSVEVFAEYVYEENTLVLDTRHQTDFVKGHIPNSLYIGLHSGFAPWVGALIENLNTPILFIADEGRENEVVTRLSRVGYDNPMGYLEGGFEAWKAAGKEVSTTEELSVEGLEANFTKLKEAVVDVRRKNEFDGQHIEGVLNNPLDFIQENLEMFDVSKKYYVHCAGGYRSVIAASILERNGIEAVNILGGFGVIKNANIPLTQIKEINNQL